MLNVFLNDTKQIIDPTGTIFLSFIWNYARGKWNMDYMGFTKRNLDLEEY